MQADAFLFKPTELSIIQFHFIYCQVLHESICLPRKSLLPMRLGYTITVTKLDT